MICLQFPNVRTKTLSKYIPAIEWAGDKLHCFGDSFSRQSDVKTGPGCGFTGTRSSPLILVSLWLFQQVLLLASLMGSEVAALPVLTNNSRSWYPNQLVSTARMEGTIQGWHDKIIFSNLMTTCYFKCKSCLMFLAFSLHYFMLQIRQITKIV